MYTKSKENDIKLFNVNLNVKLERIWCAKLLALTADIRKVQDKQELVSTLFTDSSS